MWRLRTRIGNSTFDLNHVASERRAREQDRVGAFRAEVESASVYTWRTMSDGRQQPQQLLTLSQVQAVSAAVTEAVTFALQQPEPPNAFTAENVTAGPSHSTPGRARFIVMGSI